MEIINYKNEYKNDLDNLQKSVWGEGSDTDDIFNNIDEYIIRLVLESEDELSVKSPQKDNSKNSEILSQKGKVVLNEILNRNEKLNQSEILSKNISSVDINQSDLSCSTQNFSHKKLIGASVSHKISDTKFFIDFIIIENEYQNKGIGTVLMQDIVDLAIKNGYEEISCEAIGVYGKINSEKLLQNFKFEKQGFFENYWGKKCPDFFCIQCGKKPCVCSMTAYTKFLK